MELVLQEEKKPPTQPIPPAGIPAWPGWAAPLPVVGGTRPLPQPGVINMGGGAVPAPRPPTGVSVRALTKDCLLTSF